MAFRYQLLLPRPSLVRGMARARRVSPNWCPYRHPGRCIYNGLPWWKWSAGRSYSWLLQQWHTLRKTVGVAPLSRVRRPSPPAPLLLWGAVAFVWDRERITTDEIVSRLKEYEVMVMSKVKSPRQSEPGISKLDTATTAHQDEDSHSEQSFEQELSCRSSLEEERESKRQRFIQEARLFYEQHTRESISDLPLVGLKHESRVYDWSYKVIDVCRGLRLLAIEQVSQFSLVQYLNQSLTDGSLRTAICSEATSFAADGSVEGGTLDLALEEFERPSDAIPLVGMRPKSDPSSKLLEKFFKAAWNFCRAMSDSHSNLTIGTFDNVLGVDGSTLQRTKLSSQGESSPGQPSKSDATKTGETAISHGHTRATNIGRSELHVDLREQKATEIDRKQNLECTELATQSRSEVDQPPAESVKHPTVLHSAESVKHPTVLHSAVMAPEALPSSDGVVSEGDLQARDDIGGVTEENDDNLAGWELLTKQETCVAYRKPYKDTGLFKYKVIGTYHDVTPKDFLDVQVEYEARKSWDNYLVKLETVDYDPRSGSEVIHWIFKFPFPMSSREYVFVRRSWVSANEDSIVLINRSVEHPKVPERRSYVRVRDYYSTIVIKAHTFIDELGLDYELTYFDDPQISLPSSCINWVTTTAMPDFTSKIHVAARCRASYSQKKQMEGV